MSKLIDADKLKESFNSVLGIFETDNLHKEVINSVINTEPAVLISCPKCHGKGGEYRVPIVEANGEYTGQYESCKCLICHGTGKITIEAYEEIQKASREK